MDTVKNTVLLLLRAALKGETVSIETPSFDALVAHATRHGVENLLFYGLGAAGYTIRDPEMKALWHTVGENIFISENQIAAAKTVCDAFEQNGIDYLPLKGLVLREQYPAVEMRTMGDADILIRTEQYPAIQRVLSSLGLTPVLESNHELVWRLGDTLYLELHKSLFPTYDREFYAVFGDGWNVAQKTETGRYTLSSEDGFVYIFTHFAKHYLEGGIGLRHFADLWVYLTAHPTMNEAYVEKMLDALHLLEFYKNVCAAIDCWMEDGQETEKTAYILNEVWFSGLYGTPESNSLAGAERQTASTVSDMKRRRFVAFLFPSATTLSYQYPVLKKAPVLLPFFWLWRGLAKGIFRFGRSTAHGMSLLTVSAQEIYDRQEALRYVGLSPAVDHGETEEKSDAT